MSTYNIGSVAGAGNVFGDHNTVANAAHRLADLETQLQRYWAQLDNPHEAEKAIQSLKGELAQPQPRPKRIHELLGIVVASAASVSAVTDAVEGVRAALF